MQALAERLTGFFGGASITSVDVLGFSSLKTVVPGADTLIGQRVERVGRRAKYLIFELSDGGRLLVHLSQAGRLDVEEPPKRTRPKGSAMRIGFDNGRAILVREFGTERKAAWWVLAAGDDGPLDRSSDPSRTPTEFAEVILHGTDKRRVHTVLARPAHSRRHRPRLCRRRASTGPSSRPTRPSPRWMPMRVSGCSTAIREALADGARG